LPDIGNFYFNQNKHSTGGDVGFINGNVIADGSFQWLYVSDRKYAGGFAVVFERRAVEMVLYHCQKRHDQRARVCIGLERNGNPRRNYIGVAAHQH
jgi:hypothetical protein